MKKQLLSLLTLVSRNRINTLVAVSTISFCSQSYATVYTEDISFGFSNYRIATSMDADVSSGIFSEMSDDWQLLLPSFDSGLGTLTSASLTIYGSYQSYAEAHAHNPYNVTNVYASGTVHSFMNVDVVGGDPANRVSIFSTGINTSLGCTFATDGYSTDGGTFHHCNKLIGEGGVAGFTGTLDLISEGYSDWLSSGEGLGLEMSVYSFANLLNGSEYSSLKSQSYLNIRSAELTFEYSELTSVPEPASLALMGLGLAGLGFLRRRKKRDVRGHETFGVRPYI